MVGKILFWIGVTILALILLFIICAMRLSSTYSRIEEMREFVSKDDDEFDDDENDEEDDYYDIDC